MDRAEILGWLRETDPARLEDLFRRADAARRKAVGDEVHLRGLLEISNHCVRACAYCGIRAPRKGLSRYRMSAGEILEGAIRAAALGFGTVVLQAGEDPDLARNFVADAVRAVKRETDLAVTLSLGERDEGDLQAWREAGADRYLLRFETSDAALYGRLHPGRGGAPGSPEDRMAILRTLKSLGYEAGSGVLLGLPGQTWESLAGDLEVFRDLDLDMIGVGPYVPDPATPLWREAAARPPEGPGADPETDAFKMVALSRLACPESNIPATTALATVGGEAARLSALARGANVVMPNLTPPRYRRLYRIYPGKFAPDLSDDALLAGLQRSVESMGRRIGRGPGGRVGDRATSSLP